MQEMVPDTNYLNHSGLQYEIPHPVYRVIREKYIDLSEDSSLVQFLMRSWKGEMNWTRVENPPSDC